MDGASKRIHFFKGFAATAEDWQAAERYHSEKMRLHNKHCHPAGVIMACLEGLSVTAAQGGSALRVGPGMALDREGHQLYLPQARELDLSLQNFRSKTIYVTIEDHETLIDLRDNSLNAAYAGYAFFEEVPALAITTEPPDNRTQLELARVELSVDATAISNPREPARPGQNEINTLFVLKSGHALGRLEDVAQVVCEGNQLVGSANQERPEIVTIESAPPSNEFRFYVASVAPLPETRSRRALIQADQDHDHGLSWQIRAQWTREHQINYQLRLFNSSPEEWRVAYKVYRFR